MPDNALILLDRFQYCHVLDHNSGQLRLVEGPARLQLESHEGLRGGVMDKVRLGQGQFAVVLNPFLDSEREVRVGPLVFSLQPGESLEGGVQDEFWLTESEGLLLAAEHDAPHPTRPGDLLGSGERLLLRGPRSYIPHEHIRVVSRVKALSLAENEGVYVQDHETGEVRLVPGPSELFLEPHQDFWSKQLTEEEQQALGYAEQEAGTGSRVLTPAVRARRKPHEAVVLELEQQEAVCLHDRGQVRVVFGPATVFLGPYERPKVLFLSGGVPVRPNVLRVARLGLGPDFIRDRLLVRTRDNATLQVEVTYRWQFRVDPDEPERLFGLKDFVGFVCQVLSSEIREEAANHTFEEFHSQAACLVKRVVFGDSGARLFPENGLEVIGVDVEGIEPEDTHIKAKLTEAIKTNVDIYTKRVKQEAELESERRLIEGRIRNEETRTGLVELELANERRKTLESARLKVEAEAILAAGEAEAVMARARAEAEAERARVSALTQALDHPGGRMYLELERARVLRPTDKLIVPAASSLVLRLDQPGGPDADL
ncbi:MAG: SPFH domain-containing protein [Candidatus Eremiobacterota bacterium]